MPSSPKERRQHPRVPVRVSAGIYLKKKPEHCIEAEVLDLSLGGAFVHCTAPIVLGEELLLEIRFEETQLLEARVIATRRKTVEPPPTKLAERVIVRWARGSASAGFGVEFLAAKPEHREYLAKLIQYFESKKEEEPKKKTASRRTAR